jgi:hypothetical protein
MPHPLESSTGARPARPNFSLIAQPQSVCAGQREARGHPRPRLSTRHIDYASPDAAGAPRPRDRTLGCPVAGGNAVQYGRETRPGISRDLQCMCYCKAREETVLFRVRRATGSFLHKVFFVESCEARVLRFCSPGPAARHVERGMSLIERHQNWICRMAETEFADLPDSQNSKSAADEDSQETRMSVSPETRSPRGNSGSENMQQSPLLCSTHKLGSKDAAKWRPRRSGELDAALCGAAGARHLRSENMAEKEAAGEPHERQHPNKTQKFPGSQAAVGLPQSGAQASNSAPASRASSEAGSEPVHRGPTAQDALLTKREGVFLIREALSDCCFPDLCLEATATRRATIARISLPIKTDARPRYRCNGFRTETTRRLRASGVPRRGRSCRSPARSSLGCMRCRASPASRGSAPTWPPSCPTSRMMIV